MSSNALTLTTSGWSCEILSASASRASSLAWMAARSRSMPDRRRCSVMMPDRSVPSSSRVKEVLAAW